MMMGQSRKGESSSGVTSKDSSNIYQNHESEPCYFSSSIYYGGQENYSPRTSRTTESQHLVCLTYIFICNYIIYIYIYFSYSLFFSFISCHVCINIHINNFIYAMNSSRMMEVKMIQMEIIQTVLQEEIGGRV